MMPMTSGSGGGGRRVIGALVALVLLTLVVRDPVGAAHVTQQLAARATEALDALARFSNELIGAR